MSVIYSVWNKPTNIYTDQNNKYIYETTGRLSEHLNWTQYITANMADCLLIRCFILLSEFLLQTYAQERKQRTLRHKPLSSKVFVFKVLNQAAIKNRLQTKQFILYTMRLCRSGRRIILIFFSVGMKRNLNLLKDTDEHILLSMSLVYSSILHLNIVSTLIYIFKGELGI